MTILNKSKEELLKAGIQLFAKYGYEEVTNKMVTDTIKGNSAMISYYFKNKENFYQEVIKYSADKIILAFSKFQLENITNCNETELLKQISVALDIYIEAFFSADGQDFAIIYYRNLITATNVAALKEYNRPIDIVTTRYLDLFKAYYAITNRSEINVIFVMIKIASLVYFLLLHARTEEILISEQMSAMKNLKNMLFQSVINGV